MSTPTSRISSPQYVRRTASTSGAASNSCPATPMRRVNAMKTSAMDLASKFFNKCKAATFTIDGATYTIVASTPENRAASRDDAHVLERRSVERPKNNSPTGSQAAGCPVNGQVAKQGSLTIVRRSNSRKGNLTYLPEQAATTASDYNNQTPTSTNTEDSQHVRAAEGEQPSALARRTSTEFSATMQALQVTTSSAAGPGGAPATTVVGTSALSPVNSEVLDSVDLATENLPAVDTPDACDKAAVRLRCLLRLLQRGEISAEVLQKNLHYAARVLEAVFIDETKSPSNIENRDFVKTGQNSVDSKDQETKSSSANDNNNSNKANANRNTCCSSDTSILSNNTNVPASNNQGSIEDRTKGVSSAPHTHSGPTGPPLGAPGAPKPTAQSSSSNNSTSKPTITRQRRLRTPIWARSMSVSSTSSASASASPTRKTRLADEDDELSEVQPDAVPPEVREWLASTFTRQLATTRKKSDEKPKFRSVAHAIRAGIFVDRIYRRVSSTALMQFPPDVVKCLKTLDDWSFDVFALAEAANGQPVKYIGYDLLNRYGIIHKFKISPSTLEIFLNRIEEGYCRFRNPYHNNLHAADVTQTVHHMLCQTGLMNWMTDLEIFATLLAALIHDFEHTGTTNNFHVMSGSETALLYNDRAVLENHHVSAAFKLLKDEECNVLSNLSREEYRELRTLIIDMVLSTDMSYHFQQLKNMKNLLTLAEPAVDKSKALSLVLHCCDISHPAKKWSLHHRWTMLLLEEFFRQGDLERELGLPFSPLCDRNNTLVAESQIGFIDFIVDPSMSVCSDMLECVLAPIAPMCKSNNASADEPAPANTNSILAKPSCEAISEEVEAAAAKNGGEADAAKQKFRIRKPWATSLMENRKIWKEQAVKDAEARAAAAAIEEAGTEDSTTTASTTED